jgi:hypothetical protein
VWASTFEKRGQHEAHHLVRHRCRSDRVERVGGSAKPVGRRAKLIDRGTELVDRRTELVGYCRFVEPDRSI